MVPSRLRSLVREADKLISNQLDCDKRLAEGHASPSPEGWRLSGVGGHSLKHEGQVVGPGKGAREQEGVAGLSGCDRSVVWLDYVQVVVRDVSEAIKLPPPPHPDVLCFSNPVCCLAPGAPAINLPLFFTMGILVCS